MFFTYVFNILRLHRMMVLSLASLIFDQWELFYIWWKAQKPKATHDAKGGFQKLPACRLVNYRLWRSPTPSHPPINFWQKNSWRLSKNKKTIQSHLSSFAVIQMRLMPGSRSCPVSFYHPPALWLLGVSCPGHTSLCTVYLGLMVSRCCSSRRSHSKN